MLTFSFSYLPNNPYGYNFLPISINDAGQVVGTPQYGHASALDVYNLASNSYTELALLPGNLPVVADINDSGQIVGTYAGPFNNGLVTSTYGFEYQSGAYTTISYVPTDNLPWPYTHINGINDLGTMVGSVTVYSGDVEYGLIYQNGISTTFADPLAHNETQAIAINDSGEIVGQSDFGGYFLDVGGVFTRIVDPLVGPNGWTKATGINDSGEIVGTYSDGTHLHGFIYQNGIYTTVDGPTGTDTEINGINNVGQIVGVSYDAHTGAWSGFVATPTLQNQPPVVDLTHSIVTGIVNELPNVTGSSALDIATGAIAFTDPDLNDRPTASVTQQSATWQDSQGDVFALTNDQVFKFENALSIAPEAGNTNTGKIDWSFAIADSTLDFLSVGETVTVTKTVEIDNGHGGKVDQGVTVTIHGADDLPAPRPDTVFVQRGQTIALDTAHGVLKNATDPDAHDVLQVSAVDGSAIAVGHPVAGKYGTLTLNHDGSFTYTAATKLGHVPNGNAVDTFTYTVDDGHGGKASSYLDVAVSNAQNGQSRYSPVVAIWVYYDDANGITHLTKGSGALIGPNEILTAAHIFDVPGTIVQLKVLTPPEAESGGTNAEFETRSISSFLGNITSINHGAGAPALIQGYDPHLQNGQVDTTHDLAVVGISKDLGSSLGWFSIDPHASSGLYTLAGYEAGDNFVVHPDYALKSPILPAGSEWVGNFAAPEGISGGPLLDGSRIVGVQSSTSDPIDFLHVSLLDRIDPTQLHDIHHWMHNDHLLLA